MIANEALGTCELWGVNNSNKTIWRAAKKRYINPPKYANIGEHVLLMSIVVLLEENTLNSLKCSKTESERF